MCTELERQGIEYEGNILRFSLHSPEKSKKIEKYHILFFYFFYLFTNGNHSVHRKSTILNTIMIG